MDGETEVTTASVSEAPSVTAFIAGRYWN